MTDVLDGVRDHYRATGLVERLKVVLAVFGPEDRPLAPSFRRRVLAARRHEHRRPGPALP
jgi:hypothetical protein